MVAEVDADGASMDKVVDLIAGGGQEKDVAE
jgi:hypothetical protein